MADAESESHAARVETDGTSLSQSERLRAPTMAATLTRALARGVLANSDNTIVFYDLSRLDDQPRVAVQQLKFCVALREDPAAIARAFSEYPWLTSLHVHIGSQGMSREQLLQGVGSVYDFLVEYRATDSIGYFNIGGGLPAK